MPTGIYIRKPLTEEHRRNLSKALKGKNTWTKGRKRSIEERLNMSLARIGHTSSEKVRAHARLLNKGKKFSKETREKMAQAQRLRTGENASNWQGGITKIGKKIRSSSEYKLVRSACFERDNYTCVWCGKRGVELHADHIKPFAYFPELRLVLDNLRTLCVPCHEKTDTFKRNYKVELIENKI